MLTLALEINGKVRAVSVELVELDGVGLVGVVPEGVLEGFGPDLVGMDIDAEEALS